MTAFTAETRDNFMGKETQINNEKTKPYCTCKTDMPIVYAPKELPKHGTCGKVLKYYWEKAQ